MSLKLYEKFKDRFSVSSSDGDALCAHNPMILDSRLTDLKRIADEGNLDGWMDYLDPTLTYRENKALLREKASSTGFGSPIKSDREAYISKMLARQEEYEERMKDENEVPRKEERMNRI